MKNDHEAAARKALQGEPGLSFGELVRRALVAGGFIEPGEELEIARPYDAAQVGRYLGEMFIVRRERQGKTMADKIYYLLAYRQEHGSIVEYRNAVTILEPGEALYVELKEWRARPQRQGPREGTPTLLSALVIDEETFKGLRFFLPEWGRAASNDDAKETP